MAAVSRGVQAAAEAQLAHMARHGGGDMAAAPLPPLPQLPPPMATENYEANATSCHLQASPGQLTSSQALSVPRCTAGQHHSYSTLFVCAISHA